MLAAASKFACLDRLILTGGSLSRSLSRSRSRFGVPDLVLELVFDSALLDDVVDVLELNPVAGDPVALVAAAELEVEDVDVDEAPEDRIVDAGDELVLVVCAASDCLPRVLAGALVSRSSFRFFSLTVALWCTLSDFDSA